MKNQALSTLLSLYREGFHMDAIDIDMVRAERPQCVPAVLAKQEAIAVIQ